MSKIYLVSSNAKCKSNSVLSAQLLAYFAENGHVFTRDIRDADLVVVNTCGFIDVTKKFSIRLVKDILTRRPEGKPVISLGCLVRIDRQALEEECKGHYIVDDLEQLDRFIGARVPLRNIPCFHYERFSLKQINQRKFYVRNSVFFALCRFFKVFKSFPFSQILEEEGDENKIFIQIGSGCLNQCSYCVIKKAQGTALSRPILDILDEIKRIYRPGVSLNLVADDCGSYRADRGEDLIMLLYAIDQVYPGIPLELSYLHPRWLELYEARYIEVFRKLNIRNINVSLQSGSDRILSAMKRGYNKQAIVRILKEIKKTSPTTLIWGYFMVGYPLEDWEDFYLTVQATRYYDFFDVFWYSPVNNLTNGGKRRASYANMLVKKAILRFALYYWLLRGLFS